MEKKNAENREKECVIHDRPLTLGEKPYSPQC